MRDYLPEDVRRDLVRREHRLETTLAVQYTNPATTSLGGCPLTIRSYNGALVGPTLRVRPGLPLKERPGLTLRVRWDSL